MPTAPAETDISTIVPAHRHADEHGHAHSHAHVHPHHHHAHGPGRRHPAARPGLSLLRLAVWQRLALVLPLAALIWALALAVIWGGNA